MIQLVVGWVRHFFNSSSVEPVGTSTPNKTVYYTDFQPVETVTPSQMGYRFEHKALYGLSGNAYIYKLKSLPKDKLDSLCTELVDYIKKCSSDISQHHFLAEQVNLDISGLKEVIEVRNHLSMYIGSKKKQYQDGYLYVKGD